MRPPWVWCFHRGTIHAAEFPHSSGQVWLQGAFQTLSEVDRDRFKARWAEVLTPLALNEVTYAHGHVLCFEEPCLACHHFVVYFGLCFIAKWELGEIDFFFLSYFQSGRAMTASCISCLLNLLKHMAPRCYTCLTSSLHSFIQSACSPRPRALSLHLPLSVPCEQ